ncbi:fatty acid desaturase [Paragemmobacter aquarius]|uniref:fatty acid desaturase n=1 Tax=Paragemmobacter aquarius TaxID=2169400 RepID=UPI001E568076|nr:fatty acid desaturase [Gemmobacter aquarius]
MNTKDQGVEWPTLILLAATYTLWALATSLIYHNFPALAILLTALAIAQYSSLQHEILHGHPFRSPRLNEALAFPALNLTVPFQRFRDTHLAHHHDPILTDPYDDPESNYCDPQVWATLPAPVKALMRLNNTLLGRVTIGPVLGNILWLKNEAIQLWANARGTRRAWALHVAGLALVALWLSATAMPWWAYLAAAYLGHAILKIRTFLEHRAHEAARARTVIVEDRGPLALLFLNNNLHVVHHMHPSVPWYRLPETYAANRDHYLRRNEGYVYRNYLEVILRYFLRTKDPVPHPLMPATASNQHTVQIGSEAIT